MPAARSILHVDMDAFFASVEQLDQPALRNKPVLVGYDGPRGVVAAASYEARRWGCHSAQPMAVARRRCPQAIVVPVRGSRYREVSDQVFAIFGSFSPLIEPLSVDEAFIDVTGCERLLGSPVRIAQSIRQRIAGELGLTASVGVAPNKFLAKLASDLNKPDGLTVIEPGDIDRVLLPLPVTKIWGVGPATATRLATLGIHTISDLRHYGLERLRSRLGDEADHYHELAHGRDDRPVVPDRGAKSISHEQTFGVDVEDPDQVRRVLFDQVEQVARRLRKHQLRAAGVSLKIRFGDFQTISRSATLESPTDLTSLLWQTAEEVFNRWAVTSFQPVRLIGMAAEKLATHQGAQLDLFAAADEQKQRAADQVADQISRKFGKNAIRRGGSM